MMGDAKGLLPTQKSMEHEMGAGLCRGYMDWGQPTHLEVRDDLLDIVPDLPEEEMLSVCFSLLAS